MHGKTYFEMGSPVGIVEPDVYFDEREEASSSDAFAIAREMLLLIASHPNPGLQAEVLCLLLDVGARGCSEQAIATRHQLTRAAVSARIVKLRETLDLPRPMGPMRTDATRKRCAIAQLEAVMN